MNNNFIIIFAIIYIISTVFISLTCYAATKDKRKLDNKDIMLLVIGILPFIGTVTIIFMIILFIKIKYREKLQQKYTNSIYKIMYTRRNLYL